MDLLSTRARTGARSQANPSEPLRISPCLFVHEARIQESLPCDDAEEEFKGPR
jgi:hypothetical protein